MKLRSVVVSPVAAEDVVSLIDRSLVQFGPEAAVELEERLYAAVASLDRFSERSRVVPELRDAGITEYREMILSPFRIIFRVEERQIWVVAVVDGRRNLQELLFERVRRA